MKFNKKTLSKISLTKKYAGLGGHYLLLDKKLVEEHLACGQKIGVGYPKSKNNLFREINRGVEWVFCNDAVGLSNILQTELTKAQSLVEAANIKWQQVRDYDKQKIASQVALFENSHSMLLNL